ncbi:MAG: hypothetical protein ACRC33_26690 [Gemmataceae bacterium]
MPRLLAGFLCLLPPCFATAPNAGPQTLAYWVAVRETVGKDEVTHQFDKPRAARRDHECQELDRLVTAGVDPELAAFTRKLIGHAKLKARADAAVRWYHAYGVRLPDVAVEARKAQDGLIAEAQRLREVLSIRFGVTFPPFEFPDW